MSLLLGNPFGLTAGLRIVETELVGDAYEDWSQVRSQGRAARRRKLGHPQRIVTRYRATGKVLHDYPRGVIFIHPHDRLKLERALRERSA